MDTRVQHFFTQLKNRSVTFIGIGVSHRELIRLFCLKGVKVTARDKRTREQLGQICDILEELGVTLVLGEDYLKGMDNDIIFRTPGMSFFTPELEAARKAGAVVTSEMEVFFDLCPCPIFAVTGSDGKTTTTTLISEMLLKEGKTVHLGGNIGRALLPIIEEIQQTDYAVVELSSFQLISMRTGPDVAVVTNVAPNHLDIHKDMEEYITAKKNIFLHQNAFSRTVLNVDNEITLSFLPQVRGEAVSFSRQNPVSCGAFLGEDGTVYMADREGIKRIMHRDEIRIPGIHNVENYLAAIGAVWGYVSVENIVWVAKNFGGVEHRIEFIREINGAKWYNDSIATSPTRTIAGLNSFSQKLIIIAGGYDKKIPFLPLAPKIIEKVKVLILTGATAQKIEDTVTSYPGYDPHTLQIIRVDSLPAAVQKAAEIAKEGDIVSLSPACASFDCYPNFEARGRHFKEMVHAL